MSIYTTEDSEYERAMAYYGALEAAKAKGLSGAEAAKAAREAMDEIRMAQRESGIENIEPSFDGEEG